MLHKVQMGKRTRMSFSRIEEVLEMPDLIEIQKNSYRKFIEEELSLVIKDFSPIDDFSGNMRLEFLDCYLEKKPKYSIEESKERDVTYATPMKVKVRLTVKNEDDTVRDILEQEVFMGDFPLMTPTGTFIINGAERVVASQLVRSPGVYYSDDPKTGRNQFTATLIPNRGAWLEFEIDKANVFWVKVDRTRKTTITALLRGLGYGSDEQILGLFGENDVINATLEHDKNAGITKELDGLMEMYKRLRPGENAEERIMRDRLYACFFDPKRYDLARVGRYKFNKKLSLATRIENQVAGENIISEDGEIIVAKGKKIDRAVARTIQNMGINSVAVRFIFKNENGEKSDKILRVIGNYFVDATDFLPFKPEEAGINESVHYPTLMAILGEKLDDATLKDRIREMKEKLVPENLYMDDIVASINYAIGLCEGYGNIDDIDHLGNRRVRCVGELLQNQLRVGLSRMERVVRERMSTQSIESVSPTSLINIRPVTATIREFFGSSQLSQFMDQNNPLAELTHKRRLSALGPGGLNRDRPSFEVRDVHPSHYGRMCPIETPEGKNIGLIGSLATYARINEYGFIETPYRRVDKKKGIVTKLVDYLTADDEDRFIVAQANEPLNEEGHFIHDRVGARSGKDFLETEKDKVDYMDVAPKQVVSVATAMIPFLENDDASRALMGANMQRQAVPLLVPEAPIVGTGIEYKAAMDSGVSILSECDGVVKSVTANRVVIMSDEHTEYTYDLLKFKRSNQGTCINQRPIVKAGERVVRRQTIADGPATDQGEIALGRNILIGFMPWEGYNYEDAMLISEKLVKEDIFTSIHIEKYECEARDTKLGPEEITADIPNVGEDMLSNLDENGVIRVGAEAHAGDLLVGKVTPKGETDITAEERLLHAIFGENAKEVRDTSLRVPHGEGGVIVDVKFFTRENKDELSPGVNKMVRVYIAQKRKISVGDKMAGRHGNKGVISRVLPEEDMPFLPDGRPLEIVLNPLGVPSRMNIGQVLEVHLGLAAKKKGWHVATPVFDGANEHDIAELLTEVGCSPDGKTVLYDGRTGEQFDNPVTVGYMYMLKLVHLVDDKIHARSTGPYSLVTQQPLGGKAQFGGQRFGEMEVWALEAYGAAHTLQEILTIKSDDVVGRVKAYEAIVKGENVPEPGIPESFKVLLEELRSLALDVKILTAGRQEVMMKELLDDDRDVIELVPDEPGTLPETDLFSILGDETEDLELGGLGEEEEDELSVDELFSDNLEEDE